MPDAKVEAVDEVAPGAPLSAKVAASWAFHASKSGDEIIVFQLGNFSNINRLRVPFVAVGCT